MDCMFDTGKQNDKQRLIGTVNHCKVISGTLLLTTINVSNLCKERLCGVLANCLCLLQKRFMDTKEKIEPLVTSSKTVTLSQQQLMPWLP